jgi:hypothetical protein
VTDGERALTDKRRLEVGLTEDPDATRKAFRQTARSLAKAFSQPGATHAALLTKDRAR